jgi:alpha-mannosidase
MQRDNFKAILISETHWDRAWYRTYQQFRLKLVGLVNGLLDILDEDPEFKTFTFDGQTVVLEDYLEMVPHQRDRLVDHVRNGRIDIGPWYVLPDVFLVSGEALIRNLLIGRRVAMDFGRVMDVGYIPDPFGHVSQLPMILSQFGYDSVIFARGAGDEVDELGAEFIWEASDGSEVMAHWLPMSYGNAALLPEDIQDAIGALEDVVEKLTPWTRIDTLLLMNGSDHLLPQPHVPEVIRQYNEKNEGKIAFGTLPMFVERLRKQRDSLKRYRGEFRRSKYQNLLSGVYSTRTYLKQMNEYVQRLLERTVEPWCSVAHVLGAEYPRDQLRMAWKYLLRNHPHDDICGCSIDEVHDDMVQRNRWVDEIANTLLEKAFDFISERHEKETTGIVIANPSPRSRSGIIVLEIPLSDLRYSRLGDVQLVDKDLIAESPLQAAKNEVHLDFVMQYGFDPSPSATREIKIGDEVITEFEFDFSGVALLFPQIADMLPHLSTAYRIRVNSANKIVEVWARKYYAEDQMTGIPSFYNESGVAVPVQVMSLETRKDENARLVADREEFLTLAIQVGELDGLGTMRLDISNSNEEKDVATKGEVTCDNGILENNLIRFTVDNNGTINLIDKRNGEEYSGLLEFEDTIDLGDEYDYSPSRMNTSVRSGSMDFTTDDGLSGPLVGSLLITGILELPMGAKQGDEDCAEETVLCDFSTEVTMYANSPTIHIATEFINMAEDHRLRVLFPTGTSAKTVTADSAFDIIERPIRPQVDDSDWFQPVAPTYPLRRFVSMNSEKRGLTITTRGLLEFEVLEEKGGTIALTVIRSVGWLAKLGLSTRRDAAGPVLETPGGQCQGLQVFEYAITPHEGPWSEKVLTETEEFLLPMTSILTIGKDGASGVQRTGFVSVDPDSVELSAFKQCEDGDKLALRLWNSSDTEQDCTIHLGFDIKKATPARADETPLDGVKLEVEKNCITAKIKPRGLLTLLLDV